MDREGLKYDERGLIPAVVQEASTGEVLMVAYMNRESLRMTLESGYTHFWSRSRKKFWKKGETSGNVQEVREVLYDCDADTLLVKVKQHGKGACHTGERTCFYRRVTLGPDGQPAGQ
jgi:phosphoribosyl-AMP cyclohydrolase